MIENTISALDDISDSRIQALLCRLWLPDGDRAWCRVVEFAEEFGISVSYDPLVLAERRRG